MSALDRDRVEAFKRLSEAFGPSGFESEVARIVREEYGEYADEILYDGLGSIILRKEGREPGPRVLLAGHMDEIGFIVKGITDKGYLAFETLGGWATTTLPAQRVIVRARTGDFIGVLISKPPHLLPPEERNKPLKIKDLYIDVGATSKDEVKEMGIRIGDPVAPLAEFVELRGGEVWLGKAFDDRIGVFIAMEVLRTLEGDHPNTVFAAGTVQEEVGLRGAETTADVVNPDVAIVCEVDIAGDVPGVTEREAPAKMGKGVSIITWDKTMIPNQALKELVIDVAEEKGIPYQLSAVSGGTDGHRIHLHYKGVPTIVISVPTRHIHSHSSMLMPKDVEAAIRLISEVVKRLDAETVRGLTRP